MNLYKFMSKLVNRSGLNNAGEGGESVPGMYLYLEDFFFFFK